MRKVIHIFIIIFMKSNNQNIFHIIVTQLGWGPFLASNECHPLHNMLEQSNLSLFTLARNAITSDLSKGNKQFYTNTYDFVVTRTVAEIENFR